MTRIELEKAIAALEDLITNHFHTSKVDEWSRQIVHLRSELRALVAGEHRATALMKSRATGFIFQSRLQARNS